MVEDEEPHQIWRMGESLNWLGRILGKTGLARPNQEKDSEEPSGNKSLVKERLCSSSRNTVTHKLDFRDWSQAIKRPNKLRGTWILDEASDHSLRNQGNGLSTQLLEKVCTLRLGSKLLVTCPMTSILDPDGDEVKTRLMESHWLEVVPCWSRAKLLVGLGTPYHADWQYWQRPSSRRLITVAHMATELLTLSSLILNNQPVVI